MRGKGKKRSGGKLLFLQANCCLAARERLYVEAGGSEGRKGGSEEGTFYGRLFIAGDEGSLISQRRREGVHESWKEPPLAQLWRKSIFAQVGIITSVLATTAVEGERRRTNFCACKVGSWASERRGQKCKEAGRETPVLLLLLLVHAAGRATEKCNCLQISPSPPSSPPCAPGAICIRTASLRK